MSRTMAPFAKGIALYALSRDVSMQDIQELTGLSLGQLLEEDCFLPQEIVPSLWNLLAKKFPGEPLSQQLAELASPEVLLGDLARMALVAPTLGAILRLAVQNRRLLSDVLELNLLEFEQEVRFQFAHPMDAMDRGFAAELGISLVFRHLKEEFGVPGVVQWVEMSHQPLSSLEHYQRYFTVPVRFNCSVNAVVLTPQALDLPNPRSKPELRLFVQSHLEWAYQRFGANREPTLIQKVQEAIAANAVRGDYSSSALARRLGMSLRALQRHLQELESSPGQLLEEARKAHALQLLQEPGKSIDEIAQLVGYSSERSFRRAFERWTGMSPAQARSER